MAAEQAIHLLIYHVSILSSILSGVPLHRNVCANARKSCQYVVDEKYVGDVDGN